MTDFKRTQILDIKSSKNLTSDNIYWKRLDFPITTKQYGFINGLEFSPVEPYHFSVAYSTKIDVYDTQTNRPCASLTRFKKCAYGGSFRQDGQLLVAGGEDGRVKLFSVDSKLMLRLFKGHQSAVHCAKFLCENHKLCSFSDDKTIRTWDTATEKELCLLKGHTDYVRCGAVASRNSDLIVSGSYDHTVKLWDTRTSAQEVVSLDHGSPVESVLLFPNDSLVVSAGGTNLKVWDITCGGKMLCQLSNHRKTISSICFCTQNRRLLSASLDRQVKVYDLLDYSVVHTMDYPAPIVKIGISKDDQVLAVAMTDGLVSVQHRKPETTAASKPKISKFMSQRYLIGSGSYDAPADITVVEEHQKRLAQYDQYLRTFQYKKALDYVLKNVYFQRHPEVVASLIKELIRRQALEKALVGREDGTLYPVLKYVIKNFGKSQFTSLMVDVSNILFDHYGPRLRDMDPRTVDLFRRLRSCVEQETCGLRLMTSMIGALQLVLNSASPVGGVDFSPRRQPISNDEAAGGADSVGGVDVRRRRRPIGDGGGADDVAIDQSPARGVATASADLTNRNALSRLLDDEEGDDDWSAPMGVAASATSQHPRKRKHDR